MRLAQSESLSIETRSTGSALNGTMTWSVQSGNCTKHSDCNPVLRHLLDVMNQEGETDPHRKRQEMKAFQRLHRNPKIFCMHKKCRCFDANFIYDPVDQICRQLCARTEECNYRVNAAPPNGDPMLFGPEDDMSGPERIDQVCASDGVCRCPAQSNTDRLDHHRCISTVTPLSHTLFSASFTIGTIFLLVAITVVPIWTMTQKHRTFLRNRNSQRARLATKPLSTSADTANESFVS